MAFNSPNAGVLNEQNPVLFLSHGGEILRRVDHMYSASGDFARRVRLLCDKVDPLACEQRARIERQVQSDRATPA